MHLHKTRSPRPFAVTLAAICLLAASLSARAQDAAFTTLHEFNGADGNFPDASLIQGTDGNFYGTTSDGGANGDGEVYRITPDGTLTVLHSFNITDGQTPVGGVIQGTDGNFYGVTNGGGPDGDGTIYKITPAGKLTTLYQFLGTADIGFAPEGGLVQGSDGNFYGTTADGDGFGGDGTVFQVTPAGKLTVLHQFTDADGTLPMAALIQGSNGNFYGTTFYGGASNFGTVFEITPTGKLTVLHNFVSDDGRECEAALLLGRDGNFYGTSSYGGTDNGGTVFKLTPAGTLTVLHNFSATDGDNGVQPAAPLIQADDGNFYGTTIDSGEQSGGGTVFRITPDGTLTTLHHFDASAHEFVYAGLVQGRDGYFYGATARGGASDNGTVFRLTLSGVLQFDAASYPVNETDGSVTVQVTRTGGSRGAVTAQYATANGTALAGRDYKATSGTLSWADGDISPRNVTVTLLNPGIQYGDRTRTFSLVLSAPTGGAGVGPDGTASVVIAGTTDRPVITSASTASADVGTPFSYQITAANGAASYGVSGLPPGVTVDASTGLITGMFPKVQTYALTLNAYSVGGKGSATLTVTVQAQGSPLITSASTASGAVGAAFSYRITASGNPTSYGVQGLPVGLTVNANTGVVSGTPTKTGTLNLTLNAYNGTGKGSAVLTLTVQTQGTPLITTATTAGGTVGAAFSYQITATNGPTAYGVQGLPGGLSVDAGTGLLSGTPKFSGTYTLTLNAYNRAGQGSATLTLTVAAP